MASVTNIQLGAASCTRNGVDMGHIIGGVLITYTRDYHDVKVDKFGSSLVEKFLVGERLTAEFKAAEYTLANWQAAMSESTLNGDDSITLGSVVGKKASNSRAVYVFHPYALAANDFSSDVTIYKGVITSDIKIEHKNDGEKVIPIMIEGLIDEGRTDGNLLGYIGDSIS